MGFVPWRRNGNAGRVRTNYYEGTSARLNAKEVITILLFELFLAGTLLGDPAQKEAHDYPPFLDEEVGKRAYEAAGLRRELGESERALNEAERALNESERKLEEAEEENERLHNELTSMVDSERDSSVKSDSGGVHASNNSGRDSGNDSESESVDKGVQESEEVAASYEVTAYTAFCDSGCTGVTTTGLDVSNTVYHEGKRIVASDPNVLPMGTELTIELGNGQQFEAITADTGGAIKGNRLDLLVNSKEEAIEFGRQELDVRVLN